MPRVPTASGTTFYGYNHKAPFLPQFYSTIKLDAGSEEGKIARANLDTLRLKYLDLKRTTSDQQEGLDKIKLEIIKQYPDLYGGPDRDKKVYFAIRTIINLHLNHRARITRAAKARKQEARILSSSLPARHLDGVDLQSLSTTPASTPSSRSSKENSSPVRVVAHAISQQQAPALTSAIRSNSGRKFHPVYKTPVGAHPRTQAFITRGLGLTTPCSSSKSNQCPTSTSASMSSSSQLITSPSPCTPSPIPTTPTSVGKGFTVVHNFLASCMPSMEKYLHRFIDFGCRTEDHLVSFSAWDQERQVKVLKKILSGPDGTPLVNEMDLEVIQAQLQSYFS